MKTGIELIAEERNEQIEKHGRTIENEVKKEFSDSEKLEILATYLDLMDKRDGNYDNSVQKDLRRIAEYLRKDSQSEIESLREEIKSLKKDLKDQEEAFCSMTSSNTAFKFWNELKSQIKKLESKISELELFKTQNLRLVEMIDYKGKHIVELESKLSQIEQHREELIAKLMNAEDKIKELSPKEEEQDGFIDKIIVIYSKWANNGDVDNAEKEAFNEIKSQYTIIKKAKESD